MFELHLDSYQGPLDLLLDLIRKKQLSISEISLAEVTEDFIDYVKDTELDIDQTTEFLDIVTILLRIKHRMLFPDQQITVTEEEELLLEQLFKRQYFNLIADVLNQLQEESGGYFTQGIYQGENVPRDPREYLDGLSLTKLSLAFHYLLERETESEVFEFGDMSMTVNDQIIWMRSNIMRTRNTLSSVIQMFPTRYAAVMTFLAILEVIKNGEMTIVELNDDFMLIPVEDFEEGRDDE